MASKSNMPRFVQNGIDDQSMVTPPPSVLEEPIHLPLYYIRAERGRTEPFLGSISDAIRLLGDETFNVRSKFYSHSTEHARLVGSRGQQIYFKRVEALPGSGTAALTLAARLTIGDNVLPQYARDSSTQRIKTDSEGNRIVMVKDAGDNDAIKEALDDGLAIELSDIGTGDYADLSVVYVQGAAKLEWILTSDALTAEPTGDVTTGLTIPVMRFEADSYGAHGNTIGVQLWSRRPGTPDPVSTDILLDQLANLYSVRLMRRPTPASAYKIVKNLLGEEQVHFAMKEGVYDAATGVVFDIESAKADYESDGVSQGTAPTWGPLGKAEINYANVADLLERLVAVETAIKNANEDSNEDLVEIIEGSGITKFTEENMYLLDLFVSRYHSGVEAFGYEVVDSATQGGNIVLRENVTYGLTGGADGDVSDEAYEEAIIDEIENNRTNEKYPLVDQLRYPFSRVYDTGFSDPVKKALASWASFRKDVSVVIGTHVVGMETLSASQELARTLSLSNDIAMYAGNESDLFGTPTTRAVLTIHSGVVTGSSYTKRIPALVFELGGACADYLGAGNGITRNTLRYSEDPYNEIRFVSDISSTYILPEVREKIWNAGGVYAQYKDRETLFVPGWKTMYPHPNSVLTSELFMNICVDIQKMSGKTWAIMTGTHSLTDSQFAEKSDKVFSGLVAGKYDGLVTVVPSTEYTPVDEANGYSWVQNVTVFGNVMKTVAQINVITRRQS